MRVRIEEVPVLEALGVDFKYGYAVNDMLSVPIIIISLCRHIHSSKIHFCTLISAT